MPRRKTSRVRTKKPERRLHLKVHSPRILGFGVLRVLKKGGRGLLLIGVLAGVAWGAKYGMQKAFIDNPDFQLSEVSLETNGQFTERHFAELTGIDPTSSVFALNLREIRATLQKSPGIVKAEVSRRLPGTLRIKVEERIPVAWLECRPLGIVGKDPNSGLLLDRAGICFPCEFWWEEMAQPLPVVVVSQAEEGDVTIGKELRHRAAHRGLQLIKLCNRSLENQNWTLPVVAVQTDYSLLAATSNGALVTFGMYDHERQLSDLIVLQRRARLTKRTIEAVNLIPSRNVPVRFAGAAAVDSEYTGFTPENRLERDIRALLNRS